DRPAQTCCLARCLYMIEQHGRGQQNGGRVGDVAPGDVGRTAVHGLENGAAVADVGTRCQAHAAGQTGAQIRQYVAEQVGGDDDVELMRIHDQLHGAGIDVFVIEFNVVVVCGDFPAHGQEQTGSRFQDIG